MPLRKEPFRGIPESVRDQDRFFREFEVVPDVGTIDANQLKDNIVSDAKLRDSLACSVIGRRVNTVGDPGDISASANNVFLVRRSDALIFDALVETDIPDSIPRDDDVTTAVNAAIATHAGEADPHTVYLLESSAVATLQTQTWFFTGTVRFNNSVGFFGAAAAVQPGAIADAEIAHDINSTFSDTEVEGALDALGGKVNSILAALRSLGLIDT